MKKIVILIILFLTINSLLAQDDTEGKSEYRYSALKFSIVHNYTLPFSDNNSVLIQTPYGDMLKTNHNFSLNYVPGIAFSWNYHFDAKNDKWGVVTGLEVQNNGFQSKYQTANKKYWVVDRYRITAVGIPILIKFGGKNIFRNQTYAFVGAQFNYSIITQNIQKSSWSAERFATILTEEINKTGFVAFAGFNYGVYNIQLEFWPISPIDSKFSPQVEGKIISPYSHINLKSGFFIKTGINVPLSRWLTTRNWTAEKIRRALKGNK